MFGGEHSIAQRPLIVFVGNRVGDRSFSVRQGRLASCFAPIYYFCAVGLSVKQGNTFFQALFFYLDPFRTARTAFEDSILGNLCSFFCCGSYIGEGFVGTLVL